MDFTAYLTDSCTRESWWQYTFPNGHAVTVWADRREGAAPFHFCLESSDTSEGETYMNYHGVRRMYGLPTERVHEKLAWVASLAKVAV